MNWSTDGLDVLTDSSWDESRSAVVPPKEDRISTRERTNLNGKAAESLHVQQQRMGEDKSQAKVEEEFIRSREVDTSASSDASSTSSYVHFFHISL